MNNSTPVISVRRIVSGGQTGVDRGALDAAIRLGIEHGGWCPRGRLAEDGLIPKRYLLQETEFPKYPVRTEQNVIDSDGTLIIYRERLRGGTELTHRMTKRHKRPCLLVNLQENVDIESIRNWLHHESIEILNIAGPRASSAPGIESETEELMVKVLNIQAH